MCLQRDSDKANKNGPEDRHKATSAPAPSSKRYKQEFQACLDSIPHLKVVELSKDSLHKLKITLKNKNQTNNNKNSLGVLNVLFFVIHKIIITVKLALWPSNWTWELYNNSISCTHLFHKGNIQTHMQEYKLYFLCVSRHSIHLVCHLLNILVTPLPNTKE